MQEKNETTFIGGIHIGRSPFFDGIRASYPSVKISITEDNVELSFLSITAWFIELYCPWIYLLPVEKKGWYKKKISIAKPDIISVEKIKIFSYFFFFFFEGVQIKHIDARVPPCIFLGCFKKDALYNAFQKNNYPCESPEK